MGNTQEIITCVTAIVGLITTVITIIYEYKRNINRKNKEGYYYKTVLKPFIKAYIKNNSVDAVNFVEQKIKREDDKIGGFCLINLLIRELNYDRYTIKKNRKVG